MRGFQLRTLAAACLLAFCVAGAAGARTPQRDQSARCGAAECPVR